MTQRKNRPVLFEVVARTRRARGRSSVVQWPGLGLPATSGERPVAVDTSLLPASTAPAGSTFQVAHGRVQLVLGWPHLAVIAAVLLALVATAFQVGRRSASPPASGPADLQGLLMSPAGLEPKRTEAPPPTPAQGRIGGAVSTPPPPGIETDTVTKPRAGKPPEPEKETQAEKVEKADGVDSFTFVPNAYYVVVQHFRTRDRDRAVAAREFLRSKGVECVIRTGSGDLELVATQSFASEPQAKDLVRRILDLGKEYWNAGGGYEFTGAKARKF